MQEAQRQRDEAQAIDHQNAAASAEAIWTVSSKAVTHGYLATKGIAHNGARLIDAEQAHRVHGRLSPELQGPLLVVPMRNAQGELRSLQFITKDGVKRPLTGGQKQGCYYAIGKPDKRLIVCEGFATGASIYQCTGQAVAIAFDAGNLAAVAQALHDKYPALQIIIAADDDHLTTGNPGVTKAKAAALAVGGMVAVPDFGTDRPDKATDFNDLHQIAGADAVKRCIDGAVADAQPDGWGGVDVFQRNVVLTNGADLTPEPVIWLWKHWLAQGKLHLLAGAPGQGKTTIALAIAATVTIGGRWPDGSGSSVGNVLIWSGEDDPADTLLPRLIASGADRNRVYFIGGTRVGKEVQAFNPATDMPALERQAMAIGGVKLLIVDPVVSAVAGDSHKNAEVRRDLQPIVDLSNRLGAAAIGITHLSKGGAGSDPASRVIGSIAFTAVARVVLVAAKVRGEDGETRRVLARGKSNIGPDEGGFEYHIEQAEPIPEISASYVTWGQALEGTARELLAEPDAVKDSDSDNDQSDAVEVLREELTTDCWTPASSAIQALVNLGFSKKQIRVASNKLDVIRKKGGVKEGWYWRLKPPFGANPEGAQDVEISEDAPEGAQGAQRLKQGILGTFEKKGHLRDGNITPESELPEVL